MPKIVLPRTLTAALPALGAAAMLSLATTAAPAQSVCGDSVIVEPGDTLGGISERCDVPLETIEAANPGVDPLALQVGQQINLVAGAAPAAPAADPMADPIEGQGVPPEPAPAPMPDAGGAEPGMPALEPEPAPQAEPAPAPAPAPEAQPQPLPLP